MGKSRLTPEQVKEKQDENYLNGKPTRLETMNYVNNLLDKKYIPMLTQNLDATRLALMVLQGILIDKGVCTGEDIQKASEAFIEAHRKKEENGENK